MATPSFVDSFTGRRAVMSTVVENVFLPPPALEKARILQVNPNGQVQVFGGTGAVNGKPTVDDPDLFTPLQADVLVEGSNSEFKTTTIPGQAWISRGTGVIFGMARGNSTFTTISRST